MWRELYDVYFPLKRLYGLTMSTHQKEGECSIKIMQKGKSIIRCEGEEMEVVVVNTIRELNAWETKNRARECER